MGDKPRTEIGIHEAALFALLLNHEWVSSAKAAETIHIAPRTARTHLSKFVKLGLCEQEHLYPHQYRLLQKARNNNREYFDKLMKAASIFKVLGERNEI
jgi:predicted ArsR family transcriptional regulator